MPFQFQLVSGCYLGCIIFGVGEGILSETEIAHLNNSLAPFFCLNVENK
jgi:hypothetical protein